VERNKQRYDGRKCLFEACNSKSKKKEKKITVSEIKEMITIKRKVY